MLEMLIPAAATALGGILGYQGQKEANTTNIKLGREQMKFQERMSNTAYQRAVDDMQDAGLNPMLAYSQGGASAPMGSMPQVQNAQASGVQSASAASSLLTQAQALLANKAQTEKIQAETEQIRLESAARAKMVGHQANLLDIDEWIRQGTKAYSAKRVMAEADTAEFEAKGREQTFASDVAQRKAQSREALASARLREMDLPRAAAENKFYDDIGKTAPYLRFLLEFMRGVSSAGSILRR